jgi:hypothetical protein
MHSAPSGALCWRSVDGAGHSDEIKSRNFDRQGEGAFAAAGGSHDAAFQCWAATRLSHSQAEASAAKCGLIPPGDFSAIKMGCGMRFSRESLGISAYSCSWPCRPALGLFGLRLRQNSPVTPRWLDHFPVTAKACRYEPAIVPAAVQKVGAVQPEKPVQDHRLCSSYGASPSVVRRKKGASAPIVLVVRIGMTPSVWDAGALSCAGTPLPAQQLGAR